MGIAEAFLIMSLSHGRWQMTDDSIPQLCLPAIEGEIKEGDKAETYCTEVPIELLHKWLKATTIKA